RAKARKAEQQAAPVDAPAVKPVDPRKAAVEAAIARAKARKAEQQATQQDLASAAANDDPRKAAVAAAIARVQARKATQQAVNEE
ncbi:TPA: electron transporter RnfC, partial [Klebsiella pneumoniae]